MKKSLQMQCKFAVLMGAGLLVAQIAFPPNQVMAYGRVIDSAIDLASFDQKAAIVSGKVVGDDGKPIPGVSIVVQNSTRGTITDVEGNYRIEVEPDDVLVFSFIGFQSREVMVGQQSTINITLIEDVKALDEVVVVGYGSQSKRKLTSSISSISAKEIKEMPIVGIDQSIQGRAAGVVVVNNSGEPGGGITMRIRGTTSIGAGSDPLFVIDGIPINNVQTSNVNVGESRVNGLSQINPSDIESMEILKDAAATAIYGARASNGVVIITTKRGAEGVSEISFDSYTGYSEVTSRLDLLGASDYAILANEGLAQIDMEPVFDESFIQNPTQNTDWQEEIFRKGKIYNAYLSARGGNRSTGYMISGGYLKQEGTIIDSEFKRYSFRANVDHKVNKTIKLGTSIYGALTSQMRVKNDGTAQRNDASNFNNIYGPPALSTALVKSPASPVMAPNGFYYMDPLQPNYGNPVRQAAAVDIDNQVVRLMPSFFANFSFTDKILFTSRFSADIRSENEEWFNPPNPNEFVGTGEGRASRRTFDQVLWTFDNFVTYDTEIGDNINFSALLGTSFQRSTFENSFVLVAGIASDKIRTLNAGVDFDILTSNREAWALASYFSRINLDIKDKYLFNVNARYDGSSRFGAANKFGFFPSAAIGWRISEESFLSGVSEINDLKLRVSYGITGNQQIGNYASIPLYNIGGGTNRGNNYNGLTGATFQSLASEDLSWEETAQFDVGLDVSLLKNRLGFTADYYVKTTEGLLFGVPLPGHSGFKSIIDNVGTIENRGFEFSVNAFLVDAQDFQWSSNFNIATNSNKVLKLLNDNDVIAGGGSGFSIARVGEEINFYLYEREKNVDPETGLVQLVDQNGDGNIDQSNDLVLAGSPFPDLFGGWSNNFSYKGFDLNVFIQYNFGNKIYNLTRRQLETLSVPSDGILSANSTQAAFDNRWQKTGDVTEYPRINYDGQNNQFNQPHTGWLEDGSYVRLKTLTLGYNFQDGILERFKIKRARIYLSSNNLLTFTDYSGYDPEVDHFSGVNSGANSGLLRGYDHGTYPQAKSYVLGVNFTF